ncbi:MAG: TonB-dependent receptor [Sinobacteraceae bacterium]|nr:TonB-dependent receptor [Nevskiaceae bacterium]
MPRLTRSTIIDIAVRFALVGGALAAALPVLAAEDGALAEVVVTARKRTETLQEVPLAVSAIDGATLEAQGIANITDTYSRVPNLYFTAAGGASPTSDYQYLTIRGVGFNGGLEPAVGVFIDGMYQPQIGFDTSFIDAERVEVLRGPQGTLFGRNTQGGAVNIVTRKPGNEFEGRVELEGGRFGTYRGLVSLSGPLADSLSAGLTLQYGSTDGYARNITLNRDYFSKQLVARGTVVWSPSERLKATLTLDASRRDMKELGLGVPLSCNCYNAVADQIGPNDYKDGNGIQLNVDWQLGESVTLTSITGRRDVKSQMQWDWDGRVTNLTPVPLNAVTQTNAPPIVPIQVATQPVSASGVFQLQNLEQEFTSQELRLSGVGEKFDWLVGAYWFQQDMLQPRAVDIGLAGAGLVPPLYIRERFTEKRDGWAAFGQVTFRPADKWEITLGTRYSDETADTDGQRVINIANVAIRAFLKTNNFNADNVSSMASVSYAVTPDVNVYATWAQGWKAGGINRYPSRAGQDLPYADEKSTNYDLGLKATWLDGRVTTNLALFHIDIEEQQTLNVVPDPNGLTPITVVANAGKSTSRGVELEISARPSDNLRLGLSYGLTDTRFDRFIQFGVDRAGDPFWSIPKNTASATLDWSLPLASGRSIDLGLSWQYVDDYTIPDGSSLSPSPDFENVNESYSRVNLRAGMEFESGWEVSAYVRNVFDSFDYTLIGRDFVAPVPFTNNTLYVVPLEPRNVGLQVRKRF